MWPALDSGAIEPQYADFPVSAVLDRIVPEFASVARAAGLELKFVPSSAWVRSDPHLLEDGAAQSHQQCHQVHAARAFAGGLPAPPRRPVDCGP